MRMLLFVILILVVVAAVSQQPSQKFEPATVTSVEKNQDPESKGDAARQYIIGLRTASFEYVVLYTPVTGSTAAEYSVGSQVSVLVLKETIRFSDVAGNTTEMPIVSSRKIEPKAPK